MYTKIILIAIVIIVFLIVIFPFALGIAGIKIFGNGRVSSGGAEFLISSDHGKTWRSVKIGKGARGDPRGILDLAFVPGDVNIVFAGTVASGLWTSTDQGNHWQKLSDAAGALDLAGDVYKICLSRAHPEIMYVAAFQKKRGRILRSNDRGSSFREVYFTGADNFVVFDCAVSADDSDHVIIATGQGGLFETVDGGATWKVIRWFGESLKKIMVHPQLFKEMYVVSERGTIWKTFDGGKNWIDVTLALDRARQTTMRQNIPSNPFAFLSIGASTNEMLVLDPRNPAILYTARDGELFRSMDAGVSWQQISILAVPGSSAVRDIALHPKNSNTLILAIGKELHESADGGIHWDVKTLPAKNSFSKIFLHPEVSDVRYALMER